VKRLGWIVPFVLLAGPAVSQETTGATAKPAPLTALRLQLVVYRYKGEQRISSHPYTMTLIGGQKSELSVGMELPIAVSTLEKDQAPVTSFQYRIVGSKIECAADALEGGRFALSVTVEDSSLGEDRGRALEPASREAPMFHTWKIRGHAIVRDGETVPIASATDGTTGEVTRLDVTLTVLK
jgi:Flp pilus assembly secretin CpaC